MSGVSGVGGFRSPPGRPPSFEKIDGNSDGSLSLDEFKSGAPKDADSSKAEELFKSIDSDSNGSISKAESEAFKTEAKKAEQQLQSFLFELQLGQANAASKSGETGSEEDIFAQLDADSDGSVVKDEFLDAVSSGNEVSTDLLSKLFDAIDSDSSGSVSKEETAAFQDDMQRRGPPPPPPPPSGASFSASQAYSNIFQLGGSTSVSSTYSQAG